MRAWLLRNQATQKGLFLRQDYKNMTKSDMAKRVRMNNRTSIIGRYGLRDPDYLEVDYMAIFDRNVSLVTPNKKKINMQNGFP